MFLKNLPAVNKSTKVLPLSSTIKHFDAGHQSSAIIPRAPIYLRNRKITFNTSLMPQNFKQNALVKPSFHSIYRRSYADNNPKNLLQYIIESLSSDPDSKEIIEKVLKGLGISVLGGLGGYPIVKIASFIYRHYMLQMQRLEKMQPEAQKVITEGTKLLEEIKSSYERAYTITTHRVNIQQVIDLKGKVRLLKQNLENITQACKNVEPIYMFPGVRGPWNFQVISIKRLNHKLESYLCIADMVRYCQSKEYTHGFHSIMKAFLHYQEAIGTRHTAENKLIQLLTNFFELISMFEALKDLSLQNVLFSADDTNIEIVMQKIKDVKSSTLSFMQSSLTSCKDICYDVGEHEWHSDILTYFAYIIHDSLNFSSHQLTRIRFKPSYHHLSQIKSNHLKVINEELRTLPILFSILAVESNPNNYIAYNNLAHAYGIVGLLNEAKEYAKKSIEKNPHFALSHYNLGLIYYSNGEYLMAKERFQEIKYSMSKNCSDEFLKLIDQFLNDINSNTQIVVKLNPFAAKTIIDDFQIYNLRLIHDTVRKNYRMTKISWLAGQLEQSVHLTNENIRSQ